VQMLANLYRDPEKHPQGYPLADFVLFREPTPEPARAEPTPEELDAKIVAAFSALAGQG
jgi:hypothetical protein